MSGRISTGNFFGRAAGLFLGAQLCLAAAAAPVVKIAIVGSSTAAGAGATDYAHAWAGLFTAYLAVQNPGDTAPNFSAWGYTTYHCLPTGSVNPPNRPPVDPARNITAALAAHPDAVIINLPSNDVVGGFTEAETETNLLTIVAACQASNVPVWVGSAQPRDLGTAAQIKLIHEKNWILAQWPAQSLDFWTTLANADGSLNTNYDSGDGTHLNNAGHQVLYSRVLASGLYGFVATPAAKVIAIPPGFLVAQPAAGAVVLRFNTLAGTNYVVETSLDLAHWQVATNALGDGTPAAVFLPATNSCGFFRLRW